MLSSKIKNKFPNFWLTLIRHGETEENKQAIIQGQKDTKLNELGRLQANLLAKNFDSKKFNRIYSSDLSRAYETCKIIVSGDSKTIITDPLIRERSFGELEGLPLKELITRAHNAGVSTPDFIAKDGESLDDVQKRCIRFLNEKILSSIKSDEKILIVSHGGVIRQMIQYLTKYLSLDTMTKEFDRKKQLIPPNTSVSEFQIFFCPESNEIKSIECICLHNIDHLDEKIQQQALNQPQINVKIAM